MTDPPNATPPPGSEPRPSAEAPTPKGLPLLGNALGAAADPCRFFARCYRECGPVFRMKVPGRTMTLLAGLPANRLLAVEGTRLFSAGRTYARVTRELGSEAYPNAHDGERHRELRQLLAPSLSAMAVEPFLPRVFELARERARSWAPGSVSTLERAVAPLVTDAVSVCTTGRRAPPGLFRDVNLYGTMMGAVGVGGVLPEATLYLPPVRAARKRIARFVQTQLDAHESELPGLTRDPDLLDALHAASRRAPSRFDAAAMLALAMVPMKNSGIYLYRLISFVLYELLHRRELADRVRGEVDAAFARGVPGLTELRGMKLLQGVVLEALRLYPMAIALPRVVARAFDFGGYRFQEGETVFVAGPVTHFDPAYFPEPDSFDPDRYSPERSEHRRPHAFAPFGLGPHACAARGYSESLAAAVVAGLLREAELALEPAGFTLKVRAFPVPIPEAKLRFRTVAHREASPAAAAPVAAVPEGLSSAFGELSPEQRETVFSGLATVTFGAGETVFRQGDPPDRFYVVRRGEVEVSLEEPGREPRAVARLGPGDPFGEIGILQGVPRTATVTAVTRTTLLALDRDAFNALAVEGDVTRAELVRLMERRAVAMGLARALPGLSEEALARLGGTCESRTFPDGAPIVRQGESADRFYVLVKGRVDVAVRPASGTEFVVTSLEAVDTFGEVGLLQRRPRTATVRAAGGPATVLEIPRERFEALVGASSVTRDDLARVAGERLLDLTLAAVERG